MRVLLVTPNRMLRLHLVPLLPQYGVPFQTASLEDALAAQDAPLVLLHLPDWEGAGAQTTTRLAASGATAFVICNVAQTWAGRAAIITAGARDAFPEYADALLVMALQARELLRHSRQARLELGPLVFEPLRCRLSSCQRSQFLTPGEVQVLGCLYDRSTGPATAPGPKEGVTAAELAHALGMEEPSVRKHVQHLREKCQILAGDAAVLEHRPGVGYRLHLESDADGETTKTPSIIRGKRV